MARARRRSSTRTRSRSTTRSTRPGSVGRSRTATCSSSSAPSGRTTSTSSTPPSSFPRKASRPICERTPEKCSGSSPPSTRWSNHAAFRFLDALIDSDTHFETAGSLWRGRRVWVLARLPEYVAAVGSASATYIYIANSHDGSMAVTAAVTPIRIVCANTLGAALRQAEHGVSAQRTFRVRHTGNLQTKFAEARQVLGLTINYQHQFKVLADRLARRPITARTLRARGAATPVDDDEAGHLPARTESGRSSTCSPSAARGRRRHHRQQPGSEWVAPTRSPNTSTTGGATPPEPTRCSALSRTPDSSSERSSWSVRREIGSTPTVR